MADAWSTVVVRDPEWDDASREQALELQRYEDGLCKCGCGRPAVESFDKARPHKVDFVVCQAGRALEIVKRKHRDEAKRANLPDGWDDGRIYYVEEAEPEG